MRAVCRDPQLFTPWAHAQTIKDHFPVSELCLGNSDAVTFF